MENDTVIISIVNVVGDEFCVEAEEGEKVNQQIIRSLAEKKKVILSFLNVKLLTTAFLNTAIGQLYRDFNEDLLQSHLTVKDINESASISLRRVIETAKIYYKDPDSLQRGINEILGER